MKSLTTSSENEPRRIQSDPRKLGLTQAGIAARLLGSEARRTTIVKREAGKQEITEEMALALRALKPSKTKNAPGGSNTGGDTPRAKPEGCV